MSQLDPKVIMQWSDNESIGGEVLKINGTVLFNRPIVLSIDMAMLSALWLFCLWLFRSRPRSETISYYFSSWYS